MLQLLWIAVWQFFKMLKLFVWSSRSTSRYMSKRNENMSIQKQMYSITQKPRYRSNPNIHQLMNRLNVVMSIPRILFLIKSSEVLINITTWKNLKNKWSQLKKDTLFHLCGTYSIEIRRDRKLSACQDWRGWGLGVSADEYGVSFCSQSLSIDLTCSDEKPFKRKRSFLYWKSKALWDSFRLGWKKGTQARMQKARFP